MGRSSVTLRVPLPSASVHSARAPRWHPRSRHGDGQPGRCSERAAVEPLPVMGLPPHVSPVSGSVPLRRPSAGGIGSRVGDDDVDLGCGLGLCHGDGGDGIGPRPIRRAVIEHGVPARALRCGVSANDSCSMSRPVPVRCLHPCPGGFPCRQSRRRSWRYRRTAPHDHQIPGPRLIISPPTRSRVCEDAPGGPRGRVTGRRQPMGRLPPLAVRVPALDAGKAGR